MKIKNFALFLVSALLLVSVASALSISTPSVLTQANSQTTINLQSAEQVDVTIPSSLSITSGTASATVSVSPSGSSSFNGTKPVTLALSGSLSAFSFGEYSTTLSVSGTNSSGANVSASVPVRFIRSFCTNGPAGANLTISEVDISNDGEGDEEEWRILDEITLEITVENDGDTDIEDVFVEIGLLDSTGKDIVNKLDFFNADEEEYDIGDINDGDEETATFEIKVPGDFDDGNYKLVVKAFSKDSGESNECTDTSDDLSDDVFQSISVESEDDEGKFIAFDNVRLSSNTATCGDTVSLTVDMFNIGDEDQDQVRAILYNRELSVDQSVEVNNDLDRGDRQNLNFEFIVPQNVDNKLYHLELSAEYDYRNGVYREGSDEAYRFALTIIGCGLGSGSGSGSSDASVSISASLDSDAKVGQPLSVIATIRNNGDSEDSFIVSTSDHDSWASLSSISDRILSLGAGESKQVTIDLDVKDSAQGSQEFTIEVRNADGIVESRQVAVNVASAGSSFSLGDSGLIWVVAIINVVLIILIIVVAVRISRR